MTLYTIGHSTRTLEDLIGLLRTHTVAQLADIRTIPRSRRNPQFNGDVLAGTLPAEGIAYRHLRELGGLRHPLRNSANAGWANESFRGYADYMGSPAFLEALDGLIAWARAATTAVMCAEAVWWRCHRRLLADALTIRGIVVHHIIGPTTVSVHQLTPFARVRGVVITYPEGPPGPLLEELE